jgi:SAM-dependent methyltransferase
MGVDSYKISAKYYDDAYATKKDLADLPFYTGLAKRSGGPVLEMACGTGRILLPIARAGIEIHGVDNSLPMLEVLRSRVRQDPPEVQSRITIAEGDMRSFRSAQKYALVTIPFRPLQHMYTLEDQVAALRTAAFHLAEGGLFAFDVFYPKYELLQSGIGEEKLELEWPPASDPGKVVRRYFRKETLDKIQQHFSATFLFRTYQGESLIQEETEPLKMSWYTYPQLRVLFLLAGLEIVEEYGSFAKTPLDNEATEMIFVLRKAS